MSRSASSENYQSESVEESRKNGIQKKKGKGRGKGKSRGADQQTQKGKSKSKKKNSRGKTGRFKACEDINSCEESEPLRKSKRNLYKSKGKEGSVEKKMAKKGSKKWSNIEIYVWSDQ